MTRCAFQSSIISPLARCIGVYFFRSLVMLLVKTWKKCGKAHSQFTSRAHTIQINEIWCARPISVSLSHWFFVCFINTRSLVIGIMEPCINVHTALYLWWTVISHSIISADAFFFIFQPFQTLLYLFICVCAISFVCVFSAPIFGCVHFISPKTFLPQIGSHIFFGGHKVEDTLMTAFTFHLKYTIFFGGVFIPLCFAWNTLV